MNFYKHHLGDYDGATSHLSWDEDMAYTRLLRAYYRREQPITAAEAHRLCRATTKAQRAAVDSVLHEFFTEQHDGWHNKRADEEIAQYQEDGDDREAKKENERDRQRRHRERRKELFAALRKKGIVPKFDATVTELETLLSRSSNGPVTRDVTQTQRLTRTTNQEPLTTNQEPGVLSKASAYAESPTREKEGSVRALLEKNHVNFDSAWLDAWASRGVTEARMATAIAIAKQRLGDQEVRATYLEKVLSDEKNFNGNGSAASDKKWFESAPGITAKGKEFGIEQGLEEIFPDFKARVFEAVKQAGAQ